VDEREPRKWRMCDWWRRWWYGYAVRCGPALRRVCLAWLCYPSGERVCARLPIRALAVAACGHQTIACRGLTLGWKSRCRTVARDSSVV
jgi:hypothetical protein